MKSYLINKLLLITLLIGLFQQCTKENQFIPSYPRVKTTESILVKTSSVAFRATIIAFGTSAMVDHGFEWKQDKLTTIEKISLGITSATSFETTLNRLLDPKANYNVRAFVSNSKTIAYGEWVLFSGASN